MWPSYFMSLPSQILSHPSIHCYSLKKKNTTAYLRGMKKTAPLRILVLHILVPRTSLSSKSISSISAYYIHLKKTMATLRLFAVVLLSSVVGSISAFPFFLKNCYYMNYEYSSMCWLWLGRQVVSLSDAGSSICEEEQASSRWWAASERPHSSP